MSSTLVKAKLESQDGGGTINFMFNPDKLTIKKSITLNEDKGARTAKGLPKMTFAHPNPKEITISNILFDTYETGGNVLSYIQPFEKALDFVGSLKRPPTFLFTWGSQEYIRCFIDEVSYDLTMFLPDGTPVRAVINSLKLKEIDQSIAPAPAPTPSRESSSPSIIQE